MPLENATQWKAQADEATLQTLRTETPPDKFADCYASADWYPIYSVYARANFVNENLEFLEQVDEFVRTGDEALARRIYDEYVPLGAPNQVNLYDANRDALDQTFGDDDPALTRDMFDDSYAEIQNLIDSDSYNRFKQHLLSIRKQLQDEHQAATEETEPEPPRPSVIGAPQKVQLTRDKVDDAVVDKWNQQTLKAMGEGDVTSFYEIDDLIIIDADHDEGVQPYVAWAKEEDASTEGTVTMVKKGGVFDPGSILAKGVRDKDNFEAAIARVSKKKVTY